MSATIESNNKYQQYNRAFPFQHFDKEFDFGIINEEGERVRKKKRPGRKSNPPNLQQKRLKNRVAQKAFRERKRQRRDEREKEQLVYHQKIKELKKKLAIAQFEARYLKACVLHLSLDCLKHSGSIPHTWSESRIIPGSDQDEYKDSSTNSQCGNIDEADQIPALLEVMLENKHIVDLDKALSANAQKNTFSNYIRKRYNAHPDTPLFNIEAYIIEESHILNRESQQPERNFPHHNKNVPPPTTTVQSSISENYPVESILLSTNTPPHHSSNIHNKKMYPEVLQDKAISSIPSPQQENYDDHNSSSRASEKSNVDNSQELTILAKPLVGVIHGPPSFKTSSDLLDMPALQALQILKLQLKLTSVLGNMVISSLLPTSLQRVIPHDVRIDYIPSAAIRDRMIIFQDFYDMDDCFQYLINTTVFVGGDVRDSRNWVIDPAYSMKYWFICHQLVEHNYDDCIDMEHVDMINKEYAK